jgi:hypothetical protein
MVDYQITEHALQNQSTRNRIGTTMTIHQITNNRAGTGQQHPKNEVVADDILTALNKEGY